MSNLETLTSKSSEDILRVEKIDDTEPHSPPPIRCTPDLVQDLPLVDSINDTSPVGSYKESSQLVMSRITRSPPTDTAAVVPSSQPAMSQSAAETFANSDGTIVRLKSNSELQRPSSSVKFITANFTKPKELSSFKRTLSTDLTNTAQKDDSGNVAADTAKYSRTPSVTGNAIQVKAPSIPTRLDLVGSKKGAAALPSLADEATATKSLPSTPAAHQHSKLFSSLPLESESPPVSVSTEVLATGLVKFKKPPPPIKAKPKPPPPPPKPKK